MCDVKRCSVVLLFALGLVISAGVNVARADLVPLSVVTNTLPGPVGIDVRSGTNNMIVSVNLQVPPPYDPNKQNFENLQPNGTHAVIFPNVKGLTDEQKVTSVRCTSVGAWTAGDVFTGTGVPGQIIKIHADGTFVNPWVTTPNTGDINKDVFRGGLTIDETGIYGGDMLAVTHGGRVFRITAAGVVTELPSVPATTPEAIQVFPNTPAQFGPFAGKLVIGGEDSGTFYTLGPGDPLWTGPFDFGLNALTGRFAFAIEDLKVIRPGASYYVVENTNNTVYRATAAQLAPYVGDLILVEETGNPVGGGVPFCRLFVLHFNGVTFVPTEISRIVSGASTCFFEQANFDEGDCAPPPPPGRGATRTWGFYKTHLALFTRAVNAGCFNLGILSCGMGSQNLTNPTLAQLESIFWTAPGSASTDVGHARLQLAHQLIAAIANCCYVGTCPSNPNLIANAIAALDGTNTALMLLYNDALDDFNNSGDNINLPSPLTEGKADPKGASALAGDPGCAFH